MTGTRPARLHPESADWDHDRLTTWLERSVVAVSGLVLISWMVIAVAFVDDNAGIGWVEGTWLALARYVNEGVLYPPLFNGSSFGGTRDMPLQFVIHAGLARITGEYLVSGKLLAYTSAVALYALLFVVCRRVSGSWVLAIGLVSAVLSTGPGLSDALAPRADTLPVALQLGALHAVTRRSPSSSRATVLGGFLCTLAFFTKLTALWGGISLVAWLAVHDRRRLRVLLLSVAVSVGVLLAVFELASDGRMSQNLITFATVGGHLSVKGTLNKFIDFGLSYASAAWVLVPFALSAVGAGVVRRRVTVFQIGLLTSAAILMLVLADTGTLGNHLIDVEVLTAVVAAEVVHLEGGHSHGLVPQLLLVAILWGTLTSYEAHVRPATAVAVHTLLGSRTGYEAGPPLGRVLKPNDRVLTEYPYLAVSRGQEPVVLDAYTLVRIARDHPEWQNAFIRQIRRHRFTKIVLSHRLDPRNAWFRSFAFGTPIATAIARSYRLAAVPPGQSYAHYYIYEPK
jgi:hypothetical protein